MAQTVLLTGASGFIARHIAARLLDAGHVVRASVRDTGRGEELRSILAGHLAEPEAAVSRLKVVTLDLTGDTGWAEAAEGADAILHTASPFPIAQPKDEAELIRPAVEGTLRALRAAQAAGVQRVVLTSSIAAVMHCPLRPGRDSHDEDDWTDPAHPGTTAYDRSKTLAERAAWDFVVETDPGIGLTVINPGFVLGPPLGPRFGSSVGLVKRLLSGKDPMLPALGLPVVDVRDVAEMHLRALDRPQTAGKRYIASAGSMWFTEMGRVLKAAHPARRIATRTAPKPLLRLIALFDAEIRSILPSLGLLQRTSNARAVAEMGMDFIPPEDALRASARHLIDHRLV